MSLIRCLVAVYLILVGANALAAPFDIVVQVEGLNQPLICESGKANSSDEHLLSLEESNCLFYLCEKITWNGKEYNPIFSAEDLNSFTKPALTLVGSDSLGPLVNIKELSTPYVPLELEGLFSEIVRTYTFQSSSIYDLKTISLEESLQISKAVGLLPLDFPGTSLEFYLQDRGNVLKFRKNQIKQCHNEKLLNVFEREMKLIQGYQQQLMSLPLVQTTIKRNDPIGGGEGLVSFLQGAPGLETDKVSIESDEALILRDYLELTMADSPDAHRALPISQAGNLANWINLLPSVPWDHVEDGCYSRAHVVADKLQEKGLRTQKIWVEGDISPKSHPQVFWKYHVAVLIDVVGAAGEGIQKRVIDFALAPGRLVTIEEWLSMLIIRDPGGLVKGELPFPDNLSYYGKAMWAISSSGFLYRNMNFQDRAAAHQVAHQINEGFEIVSLCKKIFEGASDLDSNFLESTGM
ncbi:MAG: protein-glutamine glutaminase family protein [Bdellovibrionia bacterium]